MTNKNLDDKEAETMKTSGKFQERLRLRILSYRKLYVQTKYESDTQTRTKLDNYILDSVASTTANK